MARQRTLKQNNHEPIVQLSPQDKFQMQLQALLKQQKYRQALEEIHKAQRSHPDLAFTPSEPEIWLLRGKQEFQKGDFKQADVSLRQSLQLGIQGESFYWIAKTLLSMNRLDEALTLIRAAFEDGSLPKEYSICYPKLLLLKGDIAAVEQLLSKKPKRFLAAQQQWLRGLLALKAQQPDAALSEFQKIRRPVTPSDRPLIWQVYARQTMHQWDAAALQLGLRTRSFLAFSVTKPTYTEHPILQRLALLQQLTTGDPSVEEMQFNPNLGCSEELLEILSILELLSKNNFHDAAHALLRLDRHSKKFPELATLHPTILTLAGEQAMQQGEANCAAEFWQSLLREQAFNPQLAVNLTKVLALNEDYQELQRLLTRIIKWLEQDYKQHPTNWTADRHKAALVYGHCRLADSWMALGRQRAALGELLIAERLDPRSPEVVGRNGLVAVSGKKYDEGTRLLSQALENGCRSGEVYAVLVDTWKQLGKTDAATETRRRFGKQFGDLKIETEVELPAWIDALSTQNYSLFRQLMQSSRDRTPAIRACQIFVEAAQGEPISSGKILLNQPQAVRQWEQLLQGLSAPEQVSTLQAIALAILLFAKREKGITALVTKYMLRLFELGQEQPEAQVAHLVILALKERNSEKLQMSLQLYLAAQPQPGNALAQIQLKLRLFTSNLQKQILRSELEKALQREPHNSLLLLAKATTYPESSANYGQLKQQGFELARRLQDAKALQAFQEEKAFSNSQMAQEFLPDVESFGDGSPAAMEAMLENMIRKMFGNQIPPDQLKKMMPQLKQMMMSNMPPDLGQPDFEEDEYDFLFGKPPARKRSSKRRK